MKRLFYLLTMMVSALSCSEPEEENLVKPDFNYSPTCVYYAQDLVDGKWVSRYYFFDLNHKETKDKQYFVTEFIYSNSDTMKVVVLPRSIDSLGFDFPAEIMDYPGYGWAAYWKNASYVLKVDNFSGSFYKDPIPTNPASNLYFLNQPEWVGSMAGKWPNAYLPQIRIPDGAGSHNKVEAYFYFKYGLCFNRKEFYPAGGGNSTIGNYKTEDIEDLLPTSPGYEWETVDAAFTSASHGSTYPTHFFFDFKNWRYFTWEEGCNLQSGACTERSIILGDYIDLDKMLKWPEGWGK